MNWLQILIKSLRKHPQLKPATVGIIKVGDNEVQAQSGESSNGSTASSLPWGCHGVQKPSVGHVSADASHIR